MRCVIRPASPTLVVRDPITKAPLPVEGSQVELTSYWRRRMADGSVVEVAAAEPEPQRSSRRRAAEAPAPQED